MPTNASHRHELTEENNFAVCKICGDRWALTNLENQSGERGRKVRVRFIEPGLVRYNDVGTVLVSKKALDLFAQTIEGRPIFNETHKETSHDDFSSGKADGIMGGNIRFENDGWYWADAYVWNSATLDNIVQNGYKVSCAYDVKKWSDGGGLHNNIPYDREVLDGEYTHMAIVNNPRYEGATIIYNNKGGAMKLKWFTRSKEKPEEQVSSEVELANAVVPLDGKDIPLEDVIKGFTANAKREQELTNAKLGDDDLIQVGESKISVKELKAGYLASLRNADDDETEEEKKKRKAKEAADKKENADDTKKCPKCGGEGEIGPDDKECPKCKGEGEVSNADDDSDEEKEKKKKAKEAAEKKERENALQMEELRTLANSRPGKFEQPKVMTPSEKEAEGYKRYGPIQTH
jgi:hypothetical protein